MEELGHKSSKLWVASTKHTTLMDLLTPYCCAAHRSPLTDLSTPPANLSISQGQDGPDRCITFQSFDHDCQSETRGRIEKLCEREKGIDLIRYSAVSWFGCAPQLNTLQLNARGQLVRVQCLQDSNEEWEEHHANRCSVNNSNKKPFRNVFVYAITECY